MPFRSPDDFFAAMDERYNDLSRRLQTIARELRKHRDHIALMNVNQLSEAIGVAPSAMVRFAKSMGFSGYSQMKALFRHDLAEQISTSDNYAERIRRVAAEQQQAAERIPGSTIVKEVIDNNIKSLEDMFNPQLMEALNASVDLMTKANALWIMAAGRSFAAAAYLTYLTRHSDKPVHWLNGLCFNLDGQLNAIRPDDVLIVISYAPYAEASCKTVQLARAKGAQVIAMTDSHLGEIADHASQVIEIHDHSSFGFRSLASTVSAVQSLFLLYAARTELTRIEPLH